MLRLAGTHQQQEGEPVNMKSAAFNDRCSKCGDVIPDNAGCIQVRDYLCDDCCKAAGHQHPWLTKPQGKKETVMKQWISPYYFGTRVIDGVMRLVRKMTAASQEEIVPEEDVAALDERSRARLEAHRKSTISRADVANPDPTIANVAASLEPGEEVCIYATTDMKTGRPLIASRPEGRFASLLEQAKAFLNTAAATVGEARTRALAECNRLRAKIAAANDAPPIQVEPETFVTKTCIYPGCGQKFETSGARMMCNDHVHRPKPDPQPDPKAVLAPVAYRLQKPLGRPTEAGPDSNPSRGDTLSHFVPEVSPLQQARDAYAEALALGDSAACSEAMEKIVRLTRAAAAPSPGMLKRIVPDSFAGLSGDAGLLQRGKPFVERTCDRCGGDFQTRSDRKTCDECLTKPR